MDDNNLLISRSEWFRLRAADASEKRLRAALEEVRHKLRYEQPCVEYVLTVIDDALKEE